VKASWIFRLTACWVVTSAAHLPANPLVQLPNQAFEVLAQPGRATVGDPVVLLFRVRLDPQDLLYDSVPRPAGTLAEGVRILSVEKLHREPNRDFVGRARLAFFRPGRQAVPIFALPFMRGVKGLTRGTLTSDSAFVEIVSVLPAGNPSLRDIREPPRPRAPDVRLLAGLLLASAGAIVAARLRRRRGSPQVPAAEPLEPLAAERRPYEEAMAQLEAIMREGWPSVGRMDLPFAAVADTLRRYLEEAEGIPALKYTTAELLRAFSSAAISAELRHACGVLLHTADLVKFAGDRPDTQGAERYVSETRRFIEEWQRVRFEPRHP
jgi:hypothetical protein